MPEPAETPGTRKVVTPTRVVVGLCLLAPFVAMLWVSSYARIEPTFIGIPFFYWYQMAWVFLSTALTMTAYKLVQREQRARKAGASQ
jgi:membrane protein implicated in regulation of membrane protease activity